MTYMLNWIPWLQDDRSLLSLEVLSDPHVSSSQCQSAENETIRVNFLEGEAPVMKPAPTHPPPVASDPVKICCIDLI